MKKKICNFKCCNANIQTVMFPNFWPCAKNLTMRICCYKCLKCKQFCSVKLLTKRKGRNKASKLRFFCRCLRAEETI